MGRRGTRAGRWWAAVLLLFLSVLPAQAQVGMVGRPVAVCVMPAARDADPVRMLRGGGRFDCAAPQSRFGPGDFLVRSAPVRVRPGEHVRTASLWQDRSDLYALYADGAVARLAGAGTDTTRRLQLGAVVEYRLPDRGVPATRLLWDVRGATNLRGLVLGVRVADAEGSARSNLAIGALYAAFAGLCLALLTYHGALWMALRHRFQLAYCAMVAATLFYAFSSSGALAWAWPGIANTDRLRVNYVTLAVAGTAALLFARSYLGAQVFAGWVGRAAVGVAALMLGSAALFAALAPWHAQALDRLYALSFSGLVLLALPVLRRAWRHRGREAWLFTLAWGLPVVLATLRTAGNFGLVGWSLWLDHSTVIAMAAEALLSSLAVAHRVLVLARERDAARAAEAAALALADADPLTGLLNRRAFLNRAIGRPGAQVLLLVDVDHFKQVNDAIGHDGGDEVLRGVARAIRAAVPRDALVARFGGEEFAILADEAAAPEPRAVLDRLRGRPMPYDLAVTASIGACSGPLATEPDWKALYRGADRALFDAKAGGRDRARRAAAWAA